MKKYQTDRSFTLWDYNVSMSNLLLRSRDNELEVHANLDIAFIGVFYLNIPASLHKFEIEEVGDDYASGLGLLKFKPGEQDKWYKITTEEDVFIIGATAYSVFYNSLEFSDSSIRMMPTDLNIIF